MMAEAHGKLTGRPGICFVTRGPGATNASPGVHIAQQDSTPMILFVGQVERGMREREAFQELDYRAVFGPMAKWVVEIDDPARIPELVSRAFHVATSGRPGPVVIALPEDMLTETASVADAPALPASRPIPAPRRWRELQKRSAAAERPVAILGGSALVGAGGARFAALRRALRPAGRVLVPPADAVSGRPPQLCRRPGHRRRTPSCSPAHQGRPTCCCWSAAGCRRCRARATPCSTSRRRAQPLVHVHPEPEELGRVYRPTLAINATPTAFVAALEGVQPPTRVPGPRRRAEARTRLPRLERPGAHPHRPASCRWAR